MDHDNPYSELLRWFGCFHRLAITGKMSEPKATAWAKSMALIADQLDPIEVALGKFNSETPG